MGMRRREPISHGILLVAAATWAGCTDPPVPPSVLTSDSAGVRVVRLPPMESFSLPELDVEQLYSTRNIDGLPVELFGVEDALFLADGSLVVANAGSEELIIIDANGTQVRRLGGSGDGPGEFRGLRRLLPAPTKGFYAWDYRLSLYDEKGEFIETTRLDPESRAVSLQPLALLEGGHIVAVLGEQRYFQREGERRDTVPLLMFAPGTNKPDTLGTWLGLERAFASHSAGRATFIVPIGFGRTAFHASNGRRIAIGSTDSLDLTIYSDSLNVALRLLGQRTERKISGREQDAWRGVMRDAVPLNDATIRRAWELAPIRDTPPGFEGLAVDDEGRLWVGEAGNYAKVDRRWLLFSEIGEPIAQVHLPRLQGERLPGRTELLAVRGDRIAVLRRSRLNEESVAVLMFRPKREQK